MHIFSQTPTRLSTTSTTTTITPIISSCIEGTSATTRKEEKFPANKTVTASSSSKDRTDLFEPPLLLTSLSTENLITTTTHSSSLPATTTAEENTSIIYRKENTKYSQKDNFQTTFGKYSNLNQQTSSGVPGKYHNNIESQQYSLKNNIPLVCDNTTTSSTNNSLNTFKVYSNFERQRTPSLPPSYLSSISSSSSNNNYYYYQPVLYYSSNQEPILVLSSSPPNTNQLIPHHPVHFQSSDLHHNQQQRERSHSLPLPIQSRQLKTFQLTSTHDERLIQHQEQLPYQPTIMSSANNNLTIVQQYDNTSVSVSPLSPMPLLSDSGSIETYKEQFIALIKEGSAGLLESEKECFEILGTCPKSHTKVAYWYGKYGGPFTWKYTGVPIDDLDLVCRMHDQRLPLKFVKKLVNLIRQHYGDNQLSKDALSYIKKIDGLGFRIIEPIYMTFFGCF